MSDIRVCFSPSIAAELGEHKEAQRLLAEFNLMNIKLHLAGCFLSSVPPEEIMKLLFIKKDH